MSSAAALLLTAGASLAAYVHHPLGPSSLSHSRTSRPALVMMAGMPLPAGSLVALATPMKENGDVDIPTLRTLLRWHKEQGTNGIVILGTTGEASCLNDDEKAEVMAVTREEVGGDLPIVVGTGTISTPATIAATKKAKLFGADAALIVTPYYVKPSQAPLLLCSSCAELLRRRTATPHHRTAALPLHHCTTTLPHCTALQAGLLSHFTQIADAVDLPIVLYNVPGRTGVTAG